MKKRASTLALPLFLLTVSIPYGGSGTATAQSELGATPAWITSTGKSPGPTSSGLLRAMIQTLHPPGW